MQVGGHFDQAQVDGDFGAVRDRHDVARDEVWRGEPGAGSAAGKWIYWDGHALELSAIASDECLGGKEAGNGRHDVARRPVCAADMNMKGRQAKTRKRTLPRVEHCLDHNDNQEHHSKREVRGRRVRIPQWPPCAWSDPRSRSCKDIPRDKAEDTPDKEQASEP